MAFPKGRRGRIKLAAHRGPHVYMRVPHSYMGPIYTWEPPMRSIIPMGPLAASIFSCFLILRLYGLVDSSPRPLLSSPFWVLVGVGAGEDVCGISSDGFADWLHCGNYNPCEDDAGKATRTKKKTIGEHNDEKSIAELSVAFTASLGRNLPQVASQMVKNYVLQSSNGTRVLLPNGNRHFFSDVMSGDRRTDQMHVAACIPSWGGVPINGGKIRNGELLHDGLVLKSLSLKAAWVSMVLAKGSVPMHFSPPCGWVV